MNAITFQAPGLVRYETVTDPEIIEPTDAILRVHACAICGSDLHAYFGRETGCDAGTAMGHEFAGEVVAIGSAVRKLRVGHQVMSPFTASCGHCFYCQRGLTCRCVQSQLFGWREGGSGLHGGQAEYVRVPLADTTLMPKPDSVSWEEALLLGDVLATGFFCARQAELKRGEVHAVIGCGPVGLMAILGARELGSENIFAIDRVPERLALAQQFGATPIDARQPDALEAIAAATQGRGADAVMEAVGTAATVKLAYQLVRPGGIVSTVGVCTDRHLPFSPGEAYDKNLTFRTGRCPARYLMEQLVPLVQAKKYPIERVFSHRLPLRDGAKGYDWFAKKKDGCMKVMLSP